MGAIFRLYMMLITYGAAIRPIYPLPYIKANDVFLIYT